jgi:hypothetical protein
MPGIDPSPNTGYHRVGPSPPVEAGSRWRSAATRQTCEPDPRCGRDPSSAHMRVTLIIASLGAGGAERVLATMANHWAAHGWPITLVTLDATTGDCLRVHPRVERIGLDAMATSAGPYAALVNNVRRLARLRSAIRASRPHAVISFTSPMTVLAIGACRAERVPVIVSTPRSTGLVPHGRRCGASRTRAPVLSWFKRRRSAAGGRDSFGRRTFTSFRIRRRRIPSLRRCRSTARPALDRGVTLRPPSWPSGGSTRRKASIY